jgi:hypothetical protein
MRLDSPNPPLVSVCDQDPRIICIDSDRNQLDVVSTENAAMYYADSTS